MIVRLLGVPGRYLARHHVALLTLVLCLGGTAYAADAITGQDIENGTVTGQDVKNSSITGRDVRDGSISARDLSANTIPTVTYSVYALGGSGTGGPSIYQAYGFSAIARSAPGVYVLTLDTNRPIAPSCNFTGSPTSPIGPGGTATVAVGDTDSTTVTVDLYGSDGAPADPGHGFPYYGFSLLADCPLAGPAPGRPQPAGQG